MPKFCPDEFYPKAKDIQWAIKTFKVTKEEVERQLELLMDHEFRRTYTDWNRVFRNWMRKAEEIGTLRKERQYRSVQELSEEERAIEAKKAEENLQRLQQMALKVVK